MDKINQFKLLLAACAAALTALWGWFGWVVLALVFLMGVDYLCGSVIAMKEHRWSSEAARSGIWHKCGCVLAVLVSGLADLLLGVILGNLPVALPLVFRVLLPDGRCVVHPDRNGQRFGARRQYGRAGTRVPSESAGRHDGRCE